MVHRCVMLLVIMTAVHLLAVCRCWLSSPIPSLLNLMTGPYRIITEPDWANCSIFNHWTSSDQVKVSILIWVP